MLETQILSIETAEALPIAYRAIIGSTPVVAPTDTVYGLMCRFDQSAAIDQLYEIKDRPPEKAIPVLLGTAAQLPLVTPDPDSPLLQALANQFWPGPLTIVTSARSGLPARLTAQQPTVGIRVPNHPWLCSLIEQSGPLAATSANRSGQPEAHTATQVLGQLDGRVGLIFADPQLGQKGRPPALASTVVAIQYQESRAAAQILRLGPIAAQVRHFLQETFDLSC